MAKDDKAWDLGTSKIEAMVDGVTWCGAGRAPGLPCEIVRPLESLHLPIVKDQSELIHHLKYQVATLIRHNEQLAESVANMAEEARESLAAAHQYRSVAMVAEAYLRSAMSAEAVPGDAECDAVRHMLATLDAKE